MSNNLHFYTKYSKEKIKLADKPFASGGEGALFHIASPRNYGHLAAKIYAPNKRTKERAQKMTYLVKNPPVPNKDIRYLSATWVVDLLYKDKTFIGVILPFRKGYKLTQLCLAKLPRKIRQHATWQRFAFNQPDALKLRLKTCFNIATALYQIHQSDRYVLVDLKPDNILIQDNGLVSIVDVDSVEVVENGKLLFPAPVATPEYTPPEHYHNKRTIIEESWDRFSLGVIFYQLLLGLHPFAASSKPPYDALVGLDDKIKYGLYVHHRQQQDAFQIIPPPHHRIKALPQSIQDLFHQCFELGHTTPEERPTATDWCIVLAKELNLNIPSLFNKKLSIRPSFSSLPMSSLTSAQQNLALPKIIQPKELPTLKIPIPVDITEHIQAEQTTIQRVHDRLTKEAQKRLERRKEKALQKIQPPKTTQEKEDEGEVILRYLSSTFIVFFTIALGIVSLAAQSLIPIALLFLLVPSFSIKKKKKDAPKKKPVVKTIGKSVLPSPIAIDKEQIVKVLYLDNWKAFEKKYRYAKLELEDLNANIKEFKNELDGEFKYIGIKQKDLTAALQQLKKDRPLTQTTIDETINALNDLDQQFKALQEEEVKSITDAANLIGQQYKGLSNDGTSYNKLLKFLRNKEQTLQRALKQPHQVIKTQNAVYLAVCEDFFTQYKAKVVRLKDREEINAQKHNQAFKRMLAHVGADMDTFIAYNNDVAHDNELIRHMTKLLKIKEKTINLILRENKKRLKFQRTGTAHIKQTKAFFTFKNVQPSYKPQAIEIKAVIDRCNKLHKTISKDLTIFQKQFVKLTKIPPHNVKKHKQHIDIVLMPLYNSIQTKLDQLADIFASTQQSVNSLNDPYLVQTAFQTLAQDHFDKIISQLTPEQGQQFETAKHTNQLYLHRHNLQEGLQRQKVALKQLKDPTAIQQCKTNIQILAYVLNRLQSPSFQEKMLHKLWHQIAKNRSKYHNDYTSIETIVKDFHYPEQSQRLTIAQQKTRLQEELQAILKEKLAQHQQTILEQQDAIIQQNIATTKELLLVQQTKADVQKQFEHIATEIRANFLDRYQQLFTQQKALVQQLESYPPMIEAYEKLAPKLEKYATDYDDLVTFIEVYNEMLANQRKKAIPFSKLQTFMTWLEESGKASTEKINIEELTRIKLEPLLKVALPSSERSD